MASTIKVDKLDPQSGTALEIGTSGDTVTVPSGVGLTLTDSTLLLPTTITSTTEVKTNKISPATGVAFALGDSGDTFTVPSGATIVNSGTATGFGGGKIGQVLQAVKTDTFTCTSATFTDVTGITVDITPSAASSKVLVMASLVGGAADEIHKHFRLVRDTTDILLGDAASNRIRATTSTGPIRNTSQSENFSIQYLDSPSSTSALTYKIQMQNQGGSVTSYINRSGADVDNTTFSRNTSTITVMEVLA